MDIAGATNASYTLTSGDTDSSIKVRVSFTDRQGFSESLTSAPATGSVNSPATGSPAISGTVAEGETLTADLSGIADDNGRDAVEFSYQWVSGDGSTYADIEGATGSSYTLTADDACKHLRVRVSFTDNDGFFETLTSSVARDEPPTPTEIAFTEAPMVVESTATDYFVLYASHDVDSTTVEYPVRVVLGGGENTTLAENVAALPVDRYRVEKYLVADPADVDGDCIDDITELNNLGGMNPVNAAAPVTHGDVVIPDVETFDRLSFDYAGGGSVIKFLMIGLDSDQPQIYFMDTVKHNLHGPFISTIGAEWVDAARGRLVYDPSLVADDGSLGVFRYQLPLLSESFSFMERLHTLLAANMPLLDDNLALWIRNVKLPALRDDLPLYRESRMSLVFDDEVYAEIDFLALNRAGGYGVLRSMEADERPHPRDVVIYQALPNELPRIAGIISTVPQTPLSHVNLRATQDGVPNAFIRDALDNEDIESLIGSHVYYEVTNEGYSIRAATQAEVNQHYASIRPTETQTPRRDMTVTAITPLSEVGFNDWDAFGAKAANMAVLGSLGLPEGAVPDGFAVPFHFYDEFMKHNGFYDDVREMLADADFQADYDTKADELKKLRKEIKKADMPEWIETALTEMHATFPEGTSLRYRSSTNNEDLPGFNGAGLYDSKTQHQDETDEDGISKSLKQVYASLWNFRAFVERDFNRVDHLAAAMGVLVHPNYSDEKVNGVAVSFDPVSGTEGTYYVNSQAGEDLVTNPEAHSVPEEILLMSDWTYRVVATSNQVAQGQLLVTNTQMVQLRRHLNTIHEKFYELYGIEDGEQFAIEIEFKITSDDVLAIKQARPWSVHTVVPPSDTPATGAPAITGTVQVGETLTSDTSDIADEDGLDNVAYAYQWLADDSDIESATSSTYLLGDEDAGKTFRVRVSFTDDAGNEESLTSEAVAPVRPNGLSATMSGQNVVLTWNVPTDFPHLLEYQILRHRPGLGETEPQVQADTRSTDTTYTDTDVEPDTLYVYRVKAASFTRFSEASEPVEIRTPATTEGLPQLTASVRNVPDRHDSETAFTFELRFSEEPHSDFSYKTLRDHAFAVDGGSVENARRLDKPSNIRWEITVDPDGNGAVSVVLPETTSCADQGAVCTSDDRMLSTRLEFSVPGPAPTANSEATGVPTISGTAQVDETLTADTTGIADADGLSSASYSYQWLADDSAIAGATGSTLALTDSEQGKAIKVRVSFTDDAGNSESLTSDATAAVAAAARAELSLADFDAGSGRDVLASALIQAGDRGRKNNEAQDRALYAAKTAAWHASGELRDGSLTFGGMTLTRVVYFQNDRVLRFNQADSVHIGDLFAAGGDGREATVWVQTADSTVSFPAKDHIRNSGSGYINFEVPVSVGSVLNGVAAGDLLIIAVSVPATS